MSSAASFLLVSSLSYPSPLSTASLVAWVSWEVSSLCTGLAVPLSSLISCLLVRFTVNCLLPGPELAKLISPSPTRKAPSNILQSL